MCPCHACSCSIAGALHFKKQREPFDNEYILGLVWQQRKHVIIAALSLLFCTTSNLAAPVLSGMLLEALVQQRPLEHYLKVITHAAPNVARPQQANQAQTCQRGWAQALRCLIVLGLLSL